MSEEKKTFARVLDKCAQECRLALNTLESRVPCSDETQQELNQLRIAIELVHCLRRLVPFATIQQLHSAFGAPGDFGYETTLGAALYKLYSTPAEAKP